MSFKYGLNRGHQYGWFVGIIPEVNVEGVKAYLVESSKPMDKNEERNIFTNVVSTTIKGYSEENDGDKELKGDVKLKRLRVHDLENASVSYTKQRMAIDSHVYILVVSKNPDAIQEQVRRLRTLYKDSNVSGTELILVGGRQQYNFEKLLTPPEGSVLDNVWMSHDYAGNNHAVRKGLDDVDGVPIGELTYNYASGTGMMALNRTSKRRIMVASYPESQIQGFDEDISASSMWGQKVANDVIANGHRVFHIVLNDFNYFHELPKTGERATFNCTRAMESEIEHIDLSKGGLNVLESFGERENVVEIYNNARNKITEMLHLISGREFTGSQKTTIKGLLNSFYKDRKLWFDDAEYNPEKTRIVGIKNHDTYPTMGDFVPSITNLMSKAQRQGLGIDERELKQIQDTLKSALDSNRSVFNTKTTISDPKDSKKLQTYYHLNRLSKRPDIMEAQFLNIFDYVAYACEEGDMLMIHGMDKLSLGTLKLIQYDMQELSRRKVRQGYLFDTIGSQGKSDSVDFMSKSNLDVKANVFNTDGLLYTDIDSQFGYTILGTMTRSDLRQYQSKVGQKLTKNLENILTSSGSPRQFQIRRYDDLTTVQIDANFII